MPFKLCCLKITHYSVEINLFLCLTRENAYFKHSKATNFDKKISTSPGTVLLLAVTFIPLIPLACGLA